MDAQTIRSRPKRWASALALISLITLLTPALLAPPRTFAQWPAPIQVNTDGTLPAFEPQIDYDTQGFAHVVWYGGSSQDAWAVYYTNNRGGSWAPQRLISTGGKSDERNPRIAVGGDGHVHVVFERRKNSEVYYTESPDLGASWIPPINISNQSAQSYEPSVTTDNNNNVHMAWIDRRFDANNDVTLAISRINGNFTSIAKISGTDDRNPSIAATGVGANVLVHIVWYGRPFGDNTNTAYELYTSTGTPGGPYSTQRNLSNDSNQWSLDAWVTSDGGNNLFIVYDRQTNGKHIIHLLRSADRGANWTPPRALDTTTAIAVLPKVDFGANLVHIAWVDKRSDDARREVFYLSYDPASNTFGANVEKVSQQPSESFEPSVGANIASANFGVTFQTRNGTGSLKAFVAERIGQPPITPTPLGPTITPSPTQNPLPTARLTITTNGSDSTVSVNFADVTGSPTQMRLAFDRILADGDWAGFQQSSSATVPDSTSCRRVLRGQLRNSAGDSQVFSVAFDLDRNVQASAVMRNPLFDAANDDIFTPVVQDIAANGASAGDPSYTRLDTFYLQVNDQGECSKPLSISVTGLNTVYTATGTSLTNLLPLPGTLADGPRDVALTIRDARNNQATFNQTIILDRTPPVFVSGQISVTVPDGGLSSALTSVSFSNVNVTDNLYPGGVWGVWMTNTITPTLADDDPSLDWLPMEVKVVDGAFVIPNWSVLQGLDVNPVDPSLVGRDIQVRVRFLDGAGNPTGAPAITATVQLASNYLPVTVFVPLLSK